MSTMLRQVQIYLTSGATLSTSLPLATAEVFVTAWRDGQPLTLTTDGVVTYINGAYIVMVVVNPAS